MARRACGWKIYWRGKAAWVWWPDGKGGKVRERVVDSSGRKLNADDPQRKINAAAAILYDQWCGRTGAPAGSSPQVSPDLVSIGTLTHEHAVSKSGNWHPKTVDSYILSYRNIETYFGADRLVASLIPHDCDKLAKWMRQHGGSGGGPLSSRTVKNRIDLLRASFRWGARMGLIEKNPFMALDPLEYEDTREKNPFTAEEVVRIFCTARIEYPFFYPTILFVGIAGSRRGVIPFMEVRDFDPVEGVLVARDEISKKKRGSTYHLPHVVSEAIKPLVEGRGPNERLFRNEQGNPLTEKTFDRPDNPDKPPRSRIWFRLLRDAGVEYRGVHNLRRSTVNVLAKADSTMEKITAVTGQTIEVARRCYLSIDAKSQRETMEKLSEIYGLANIPEPCKVVAEPELINTSSLITLTLEPPAARALTRLLQLPPADSGTKSGTTGTLVPLKPRYIKDRRKLAERGGFVQEKSQKPHKAENPEVTASQDSQNSRIFDIIARILAQIPAQNEG
jgi:integrase